MIAVVGTVPDPAFPVCFGAVELAGEMLQMSDREIPVNRGTPALLAAVIQAGKVLDQEMPVAFLVGDVGLGEGSRELYAFLEKQLPEMRFSAICFHYLQPDVDWQYRVLTAVRSMSPAPLLIADAGFMYAAKMGGQSEEYHLFTPDVGELAFLADEEAPHPFYTRGFILHEEQRVPELIERAYLHENAAEYLLVKGKQDYIVRGGKILETVDQPATESLEAIGGTGDTLTGMVAALIGSGIETETAAVLAARANRLAGAMADPTPASQVLEIINCIPDALAEVLKNLSPDS